MLHEMVSAHVSRGLFNGTSGFCPVAATKGMPRDLIQLLADLGKRQYDTAVANKALGREMYCHLPINVKGRRLHLVSRGIQLPGDNQARLQYIVHQLLLENVRDLSGGPAWLLANDQVWINQWNIDPQFLESRTIESSVLSPRICETWTRVAGDAGWAGMALEAWQRRKPFVLVISPDKPTRPIIDMLVEAQSLMDPQIRWEIPISISSWHPTKKLQRIWVVYAAGSQDAINSFRASDRVTVDITRKLEPATNSYSEIARAGAWARFSETDGKASAKNHAGNHASSPLFEGTDSATEDGLLAPLERPMQSQRPRDVLATAKGSSNWKALKPKRTFQQAIPWTKRGLVVALLVLVGFGIWKGAQFLQTTAVTVFEAINSGSNGPDANEKLAVGDDGTKSAADPLNPNVTDESIVVGNASNHTTDSDEDSRASNAHLVGLKTRANASLTSTAGQRLLKQLRADFPYMEFPVEISDGEFLAFTVSGTESLLGALGFGLATPQQFLALERVAGGNAWSLHREPSEDASSLDATLSSALVTNDKGGQVQFYWKWQTPPDDRLAAEIKSGAFCVWLLADPQISAAIPLSPPTFGKPASILDAMYDGITFTPHLSTELVRPEAVSRIKWFAEPIGFANLKSATPESVGATDDLWVVFNAADNMSLLRMNTPVLRREIEAAVPGNPKANEGERTDTLQILIDRTAPIQLEVRMDPPSYIDAKSATMITRGKAILFMKGDDGSTCSLIFQHQPQPEEKSRKQEFEDQLKAALIRWLAASLNLDTPLVEALNKGKPYSPKAAAAAEARAKADFAQKLVQVILRELDQEFEFRAVRSTTLHSELGEFVLPITAYQGK